LPNLAPHRAEYWTRQFPNATELQLTLSAPLQRALEQLAIERAEALGPRVSLAMLVADHRNGEILASIGSAAYTDVARDGFIDMTDAVRSPGSTLKPLIYGLAFELGLAHPESLIEDRPQGFGHYAPANFDGDFAGTLTLREALQRSLNVPAVTLLEQVGPARLLARLRRAGVNAQLPGERPPGLAIALGGIGLRLRDLVALYTAIAGGGQPRPLRELQHPAAPQPVAHGGKQPVLDARAAWYLTSILSGADAMNTGTNAIALKTGTSYGYRDAWALGFDGRHVVGVWAGRPDGVPVADLTGAKVAVPILIDAFTRIGPATAFAPAPAEVLQLASDQLPRPLRRVDARGGTAAPQVEIAYPPDGARIDLQPDRPDAAPAPLILKARGGKTPLRWFVNGNPLPLQAFARPNRWQPDGRGFTEILLIDAAGAKATAAVLID
jgi:penicillin-binding protein 1C